MKLYRHRSSSLALTGGILFSWSFPSAWSIPSKRCAQRQTSRRRYPSILSHSRQGVLLSNTPHQHTYISGDSGEGRRTFATHGQLLQDVVQNQSPLRRLKDAYRCSSAWSFNHVAKIPVEGVEPAESSSVSIRRVSQTQRRERPIRSRDRRNFDWKQKSGLPYLWNREKRRAGNYLGTNLKEVLESMKDIKEAEENNGDGSGIMDKLLPITVDSPISNLSILAKFIDLKSRKRFLDVATHDSLLRKCFSTETINHLTQNGYEIGDVIAWSWILEAESDRSAALRLSLWDNRPLPHSRVPFAVLHFISERKIKDGAAVQLLVTHLWHRLSNRLDLAWKNVYLRLTSYEGISGGADQDQEEGSLSANYQPVSVFRLIPMLLRLIEQARHCIPALLPNLAVLFCTHVEPPRSLEDTKVSTLTSKTSRTYATAFNLALCRLAGPVTEPFVNVRLQERAQFIIIRHMNDFEPALPIGQAAYRAIISVQLRHKKTNTERVWAGLKSRGWPPYREDKLGLDSSKKDEIYGISRAQRAIRNRKEAGYAATEWEHSASVLSGWDVDQSPTIQTRRIFLPENAIMGVSDEVQQSSSLWENRILTTRTVEEAWAMFLNYMDEDIPRTPKVFLAMLEKLFLERQRKQLDHSKHGKSISTAVAGDMPATWPSSPNPRDMVYTPIPPPTQESFLEQFRDNLPLTDDHTAVALLKYSHTLEEGLHIVDASSLDETVRDALLGRISVEPGEILSLTDEFFSAFIGLLARHPFARMPTRRRISVVSHAINLIKTKKPEHHGSYRHILQALPRVFVNSRKKHGWQQDWHALETILSTMKEAEVSHNSETFNALCTAYTRSVFALFEKSGELLDNEMVQRSREVAHSVKSIFSRMVSLDLRQLFKSSKVDQEFSLLRRPELRNLKDEMDFKPSMYLPHLVYTPSPVSLHLLLRLLGTLEDRQGVVDLARWISSYYEELESKISDLSNGAKQFRLVLVALRIVTESETRPFVHQMVRGQLTGQDSVYAKEAHAIVKSMPAWGGWPNDEEVDDYFNYYLPTVRVESNKGL